MSLFNWSAIHCLWGLLCHAAPVTPPVPAPPPVIAPAPVPAPKAAFWGLTDMGDESFLTNPAQEPVNDLAAVNANPGLFRQAVCMITWDQIEPQPGVYNLGQVNTCEVAARAYNAKYPATPITLKLREFDGIHSPAWVLTADGGPVMLTASTGQTASLPHWWSAVVDGYKRDEQTALASVLNADPLIGEVAVSSCESMDGEPFITPISATTAPILTAGATGLTDAAMRACLSNIPADMAAWTIPVDLALNPLTSVSKPSQPADGVFPTTVAAALRAAIGSRAVIANHGIGAPPNQVADTMLASLQAMGGPFAFQSYAQSTPIASACATAATYGAPVELEWWAKSPATPAELAACSTTLPH